MRPFFALLCLSVFFSIAPASMAGTLVEIDSACPTPHNDCTAACGTTCTYWKCEDHTTVPVHITELPTTFIRAKAQCTERIETVVVNQLPLPSAQQAMVDRVVGHNDDRVNALPLDFFADSHACVSYSKPGPACSWITGSWGACSATCGGGTQTRSVTCSGTSCDPTSKPAVSQACNTQACSWLASGFGTCSATCGGGTQTQTVTCGGSYCDPATKPPTSTSCNTQSCSWITGSWGACSATACGTTGTQSRSVTCGGAACDPATQPAGTQSCSTNACAGKSCAVAAYSVGESIYEETFTIADGASKTFYQMFYGNKCSGTNPVNLTCKNGLLSGLPSGGTLGEIYSYPIPLDCSGGGSPLMVHLNVNPDQHVPLEFTSPLNGINFDLFGANAKPAPYTPVRISWYRQPEYYFIVLPNTKGEVKGIDELFGNNTKGPDGQFAKDGYVALAKYDGMSMSVAGLKKVSEPDGYITSEDPVLAKLRFWHDDNFDGLAQPNELRTADELGIELIDLAADESFKETDQYGNDTMLKSVVRTKDGRFHVMFDVWFWSYDLKRFEVLKKAGFDFIFRPEGEKSK